MPCWAGLSLLHYRQASMRAPHFQLQDSWQSAPQWWLHVLTTPTLGNQTARFSKERDHSYLQGAQMNSCPSLLWSKLYRHEEWNWTTPTNQMQGFTWWSQAKSQPCLQTVWPSALQKQKMHSSLFLPKTSGSQRLPRSHRLLAKQRKETSSSLVHPLWKHKSAIRSYRIFFLFIINIIPEAVTCRIKEVWKDFNWLW